MKIDPLKEFLKMRLGQEMPGEPAHVQMQPKLKNGSNIRFNHKGTPREGGVLILFYEEEGIVRFPLIERPEYEGIHSGQIALPGGKKEPDDSSLVDTALREAEEEIGINSSEVEVLGSLSQFYVGASNYDILPVIGMISEKPQFQPDPREVAQIITPTVADLISRENRKAKDINVRNGYTLLSPYFDLQDKIVWGATAMILSELVVILNEFNK